MLPLLLLDALKRHSDSAHTLRILELVNILAKEYETPCERKAVKTVWIGRLPVRVRRDVVGSAIERVWSRA